MFSPESAFAPRPSLRRHGQHAAPPRAARDADGRRIGIPATLPPRRGASARKGQRMSEHPLRPTRRAVLAGTLGALGALAATGPLARAADRLPPIGDTAPADWSRAVIDSTMKRYT